MAGTARTAKTEVQDPSVNVLMLVGNATKYLEDLHKQSHDFLCEKMQLAIETSQRERTAESSRINALRVVDLEAVRVANERDTKQKELLATQLLENAEVLRKAVDETAKTLANNLQQITTLLDNRLKEVEKKQYEYAGTSKGKGDMWGYVFGAIMLIIAVASFFMKW